MDEDILGKMDSWKGCELTENKMSLDDVWMEEIGKVRCMTHTFKI